MATILVVEDNDAVSLQLESWLKKIGHKVVRINDGYNAFAAFEEHRPGLVVLDYHLPAASGTQVYQRIRSLAYGAKTPVIFLSGEPPAELMFAVPAGDPARFLQKPVLEKVFSDTLAELLAPPQPK